MNWAQFKDPASHMCFAGAMVASWYIKHEVTGMSLFTIDLITNIFVTEFSKFSKFSETFRKCSIEVRDSLKFMDGQFCES